MQFSWKGIASAILFGIAVTLALAEIGARLAMPHWREFHNGRFMDDVPTRVPEFGSVILGRRNFDGYFAQNNGDFRVHVRINDFGLRANEPIEAADNRVWTIGDSITFGWGVEYEDIYAQVVARQAGVPVYNIASPGADVCGYQALWGRMPRTLRPRAVIVGLVLENDLRLYDCRDHDPDASGPSVAQRLISWAEVKWHLTRISALYNFIAITLKRINIVDETLITLGIVARPNAERHRFDAAEVAPVVASTGNALVTLKSFVPRDIPFVVLIIPTRIEIRNGDPAFRDLRLKMQAALRERDIETVDPIDSFIAAGFQGTHFAHDGHWSKQGHAIAGEALSRWLADRGLRQN